MSERDFSLYLADILDSGSAIAEFVKDLSFEEFCNDRKTYSAVIREFEIIGEAVGKLPDELKLKRPDVEWQDINDFRNLLIHEYFFCFLPSLQPYQYRCEVFAHLAQNCQKFQYLLYQTCHASTSYSFLNMQQLPL